MKLVCIADMLVELIPRTWKRNLVQVGGGAI